MPTRCAPLAHGASTASARKLLLLSQPGASLMGALETFPRITPFLWFDSNAEEAVEFYISVFKNSRRLQDVRNLDENHAPIGTILTIAFELDGQKFTALN